MLLIFLLTFIVALPVFLFISIWPSSGSNKRWYRFFKTWSFSFFSLIGIIVRVKGKEKIQSGKKYIVIANHQSFLDIPMIFSSVPFWVKPLARADLAKIPLFGLIYKKSTIPVDRSSISSKKESYKKMLETIKNEDTNVFIFPEGSFNETEHLFKTFYEGAFRIAKETDIEILPIIFPDTGKRWHYSSFWAWSPGISRAFILDPIALETIRSMSSKELKEHVLDIMNFEYAQISLT